MIKINIVIADNDSKYLDLFLNYLRTSEYAEKFNIKSFSRQDSLDQYIDQSSDTQIWLLVPEMLSDRIEIIDSSNIILLKGDTLQKHPQYKEVYKYQPLNQLLSQLINYYIEADEQAYQRLSGDRKTKVISVYSATGGCGKTIFAANLALRLAEQNQKIFYLNLEYLSSEPVFFPSSEKNDFSKVLYYLKANSQQIEAQFETLKKHEQFMKIDYFEPLTISQEILDMTRNDSATLIDIIANRGVYDLIIVDLDDSTHDRIIGALAKSDYIFWLLLDDIQCLSKSRMQIQELNHLIPDEFKNIAKRVRFILNKRLDEVLANPSEYGLNVSGYLPYIPEWKAIYRREQIFSSIFFKQEASKLYASMVAWK